MRMRKNKWTASELREMNGGHPRAVTRRIAGLDTSGLRLLLRRSHRASSSNARQYTLAQCVRLGFARKVLGASVRYCHSQVSRRTCRMRDGWSRPAALARRRRSVHVARTVTSACARHFALRHTGSVDVRGTCHDLCVGSTGCSRERAVGDIRSTCGGGAHSGPILARHGRASERHAWRAVITPRGHPSDWTAAARCHGGGTRTEAMPAAVAAWMPNSVSSKTRQWAGATPSRSAAIRNASGWGLPCV